MRVLLLLTSLCYLFSGCGSAEDQWEQGRPKVVPATVTVLFNGEPLEGASVFLSLQNGSSGATAETDKQGKGSLTTFKTGDGVIPGNHLVKINKVHVETTVGTEKLPDSDDYPVTIKRTELLPEKYGDYKTSGLTVTATQEGPNEFVFELTGK